MCFCQKKDQPKSLPFLPTRHDLIRRIVGMGRDRSEDRHHHSRSHRSHYRSSSRRSRSRSSRHSRDRSRDYSRRRDSSRHDSHRSIHNEGSHHRSNAREEGSRTSERKSSVRYETVPKPAESSNPSVSALPTVCISWLCLILDFIIVESIQRTGSEACRVLVQH